ncbi:uncharacterized protein TOT_030000532 [Theileria orientalis strain Shintoku]|uniref:Uncharacterized protein n=1 Tax=Theileria orientalis strain Shintoku TaxID=869250 RepID=J4DPT6_THEOR|nr:uncharacterized protein TOT_030000532 [Theileria orientalis strain Shintoku]BAM41269.1 uncharacterized protein TOT_030000532 [Theileria orientalis strain Shintoku]|eukprot:XP_009691570.1 uncharacterized protein TOT_030000532 [Theileria orientalis strain Shintoku]
MYNLLKFRRFLNTSRNIVGKHKHEQIVCVETEIYSPFINNDIYYRGYPLSKLATRNKFLDNFYLLLNSDLPSKKQDAEFANKIKTGMKDIPAMIRNLNAAIPANINICNFDREYGHIFGQCLGILSERYFAGVKYKLDSEDPLEHSIDDNNCNQLDESVSKLLNAVFTIYMEHGLTSASYSCRICISEGGSTFSGLICASATHKYAMETLNSYLVLKELTDKQLQEVLKSFEFNNNLKFPLDEITFNRRDPRCRIIAEICKEHFGEDIFSKLSEIENKFSNRLYFKFDVYVFELMKRLYHHVNNGCDDLYFNGNLFNKHLKDKIMAMLMSSRIAGVSNLLIHWSDFPYSRST